MPVLIDIFDFKCFNQLRNGVGFNKNLSDFTPNLVGNIGETIKVEFTANIQQSAFTEGLEEWEIFNTLPTKRIERSSGSFLEDRLQVGDVYEFYADWLNRRAGLAEYTGQINFISSDGRSLEYTVLSGSDTTGGLNVNVGMAFNLNGAALSPQEINKNTAAFLRFGLLSNDETFNFLSKTTGSQQVYYAGGLASVIVGMESLGSIKDWVTGAAFIQFQIAESPDFLGAQYTFQHIFVLNPFYVLEYRQFIETNTVPDLLAGDNSLKYAAELEFRKSLTDTGSSKIQDFNSVDGFVGWYGENFNGLNTNYEIASVTYQEVVSGDPIQGININAATITTITVSDISGPITDYSCAVYLIRVPQDENEYIGTTSNLLDNFLYKSEIVSSPDTSTPNVTTSIVGGNLVIAYTVDFTTAERLRLTTEDEYLLFIQIEDPTTSAGNSDRTVLLADFRNYVDVNFLADFLEFPTYNFLVHGESLGVDEGNPSIIAANEDGILLNTVFGTNTLRSVVVNSIGVSLLAYNPLTGESFELDFYDFSIGEPVFSGKGNTTQEIQIDTTRGYPLPVGDEFNLARITTGASINNFRQYALVLGQKIKWQDWVFNPDVDPVFFNALQPNNNLNDKSSNYSGKEDYEIRLALIINVTGLDDLSRTLTGNVIHYGGLLSVNDYGESEDGVTGIIETFDLETGNSLQGNILYNGKDTLFRSTFQNAFTMLYGIHRIEPSQNQGDGILELSSVVPSVTNNLLKPLDGQTQLTFSFVGPNLVMECLVDGSLIQENISYKLSSRVGAPTPKNFVSTWNTSNISLGSSAFNQISLPLISTGNYGFVVDWGDGNTDIIFQWDQPETTHTYGVPGVYQLTITGIVEGFEFNNTLDRLKILDVSDFEALTLTGPNSFYGCANLTVSAVDGPNVATNNLSDTFRGCSSLLSIGTLDVSGVADMTDMFRDCSVFNSPDILSWNTAAVTTMQNMFQGCTLFDQDISIWNVGSVENMSNMFRSCEAFNQNIGGWNVSSVKNMSGMFAVARLFNQNIGGWNVSNVENMSSMFNVAQAFDQSLNSWNVSNVTDMNGMFFFAISFNQDLNNWNVGLVTNMFNMFNSATLFNGNITTWDVSSVVSISSMFNDATSFNQDIGGWNTGAVQFMSSTFNSATSFNQDIGGWNTGVVTTMANMFNGATSFNQNIGSWNTGLVTDMNGMFQSVTIFNQDIGSWNTGSVINMSNMFNDCNAFNGNIGLWDTSSVTNMSNMLRNCINFNQNLSTWNTGLVTSMFATFQGAVLFNSNIQLWNVSSVTSMSDMFEGAVSFDQDLAPWDIQSLTAAVNMFNGVTLSVPNYDSLLAGWNANPHNNNVVFSAGNSICTGGLANPDRVDLVGDGWTITDGN